MGIIVLSNNAYGMEEKQGNEVDYTYFECSNNRSENQDRAYAGNIGVDEKNSDAFIATYGRGHFLLIADGHGDEEAVDYIEENIKEILNEKLKNEKDVPSALKATFLRLDEKIRKLALGGGAALTVAYRDHYSDELFIAWAGDSRLIIVDPTNKDNKLFL